MQLTGFETTLLGVVISFSFSIFGFFMGRAGTVSAKTYEANRQAEEKARAERLALEMAKCRDRETACKERETGCQKELRAALHRIEAELCKDSAEHDDLHSRITTHEGRLSRIEGQLAKEKAA